MDLNIHVSTQHPEFRQLWIFASGTEPQAVFHKSSSVFMPLPEIDSSHPPTSHADPNGWLAGTSWCPASIFPLVWSKASPMGRLWVTLTALRLPEERRGWTPCSTSQGTALQAPPACPFQVTQLLLGWETLTEAAAQSPSSLLDDNVQYSPHGSKIRILLCKYPPGSFVNTWVVSLWAMLGNIPNWSLGPQFWPCNIFSPS